MVLINLLCCLLLTGTDKVNLIIDNCSLDRDIVSLDFYLENNNHRRICLPGFSIINGLLISPHWELQIIKDGDIFYPKMPYSGKRTNSPRIIVKAGEKKHFQLIINCSQLIDKEWQTMANLSGNYSFRIIITLNDNIILCSNTAHLYYE